jgi:hypothetical protein
VLSPLVYNLPLVAAVTCKLQTKFNASNGRHRPPMISTSNEPRSVEPKITLCVHDTPSPPYSDAVRPQAMAPNSFVGRETQMVQGVQAHG